MRQKGDVTVSESERDEAQGQAGAAGKRRRNAATTRQAILDSARLAFTRYGYDGVGVREIAKNAGVTAMLVNRYFGSKEKLFAQVVEETLSGSGVLRHELARTDVEPQALCRNIAAALVAKSSPGLTPDGILVLLRSAANKQAAGILRDDAQRYLEPLIALLSGSNPGLRAAMVLSLISGFQLMRQVIGLPALAEARPQELEERLQALFACLLRGEDDDPS